MDKPMVIVGGGIGGLATALAAARAGLPVQLLEQAPLAPEDELAEIYRAAPFPDAQVGA